MQQVKAIIRHERLDSVRDALERLKVPGVTVTEVKGFGHQRGYTESYRGAEKTIYFRPKLELLTIVDDSLVDDVLDAIAKAAHTGEVGDGKIFVSDVSKIRRIRTGERDLEAL